MKKLIILSFLLAFSVSMMAQRSGSATAMVAGATTKVLTMLPVDSVTQHATAYWTFIIDKPYLSYFAVAVSIDTIGAVPCGKTTWDVQGSMDNTNWIATTATQVRPGGTTAGLVVDTTFYMGDVATGVLWKYLKVKCVSSSSLHIKGIRVSGLSLKVGAK
jgi:hypothetical protein